MTDEKKVSHISPERRDRFTWQVGDLKFLTAEEFEQVKQSEDFINYDVQADKETISRLKFLNATF